MKKDSISGYMPPTSLSVSYGIELDTLGEELQTAGKLIPSEKILSKFSKRILS
jgi:hypothetical protein